ncbi:hypothetical protein GCM10009720_16340 [Yaniella flava]|uniref:Uncharacterized protein n=1 Tax=Yaniella flava TaxID=287930 RepID=A0ABP5FY14_9MICC|nr:hypothetical protein [Micrococcaceae bacterium]
MTTTPPDIDTDLDIDQAFQQLTGHQPSDDDGADKDRFSHYSPESAGSPRIYPWGGIAPG